MASRAQRLRFSRISRQRGRSALGTESKAGPAKSLVLRLIWKKDHIWKGPGPNEPHLRGFPKLTFRDSLDVSFSNLMPSVVMPSAESRPLTLNLKTYYSNPGNLIWCGLFLTMRKHFIFNHDLSLHDSHALILYIRGSSTWLCAHEQFVSSYQNIKCAYPLANSLTSRNVFCRYMNRGVERCMRMFTGEL